MTGVTVPSAFETCVTDDDARLGAEQLLVLLENDLAAIVDRRDAQRAPFSAQSCCQGTILA